MKLRRSQYKKSTAMKLAPFAFALTAPFLSTQVAGAEINADELPEGICAEVYDETKEGVSPELEAQIQELQTQGFETRVTILKDARNLGVTDEQSLAELSGEISRACENIPDIQVLLALSPGKFNTRLAEQTCVEKMEKARDANLPSFESDLREARRFSEFDAEGTQDGITYQGAVANNLAALRDVSKMSGSSERGSCDQDSNIPWIVGLSALGVTGVAGGVYLATRSRRSRDDEWDNRPRGGSGGSSSRTPHSTTRYTSGSYSGTRTSPSKPKSRDDGYNPVHHPGIYDGGSAPSYDGGSFGGSDGGGSFRAALELTRAFSQGRIALA